MAIKEIAYCDFCSKSIVTGFVIKGILARIDVDNPNSLKDSIVGGASKAPAHRRIVETGEVVSHICEKCMSDILFPKIQARHFSVASVKAREDF